MPLTENDVAALLTIEEAAEFLGRGRTTIYRLIADGEIDVVRIGTGRGRTRVTRRALLDYANRRVVPAKGRRRRAA